MGGFEGTSDLYRASSRMPAWRRRAHHLPRLAPARQFHDPAGVEGLFRLSDAARARAERERQAYWVVAQGDTRLTGCPDCGRVRGVAAAQKAQTTNQGENEVEEMTGRLVAPCDRRRRNQPAWCEGGTGGLSGGRVGSAGADTRPSRLARRLSPATAARATATTRVGNQTWTSA
jgi:hypothetical protein